MARFSGLVYILFACLLVVQVESVLSDLKNVDLLRPDSVERSHEIILQKLKEEDKIADDIELQDEDDESPPSDSYWTEDVNIEDPPDFDEPYLADYATDRENITVKHGDVEVNPDLVILQDEHHKHIIVTKHPLDNDAARAKAILGDFDEDEDSADGELRKFDGETAYMARNRNKVDEFGEPGMMRIKDSLVREKGIRVGSILTLPNGIFRVYHMRKDDLLDFWEVQCQTSTLDRAIKNAEWGVIVDKVNFNKYIDGDDETERDIDGITSDQIEDLHDALFDLQAEERMGKFHLAQEEMMDYFDENLPELDDDAPEEHKTIYAKAKVKARLGFRAALSHANDYLEDVGNTLLRDSDQFLGFIRRAWRSVRRAFRRVGGWIRRGIRTVVGGIKKAVRWVKRGVKKAWDGVKKVVKKVWDKCKGVLGKLVKGLGKYIKMGLSKLVGFVKGLAEKLVTFLKLFAGIVKWEKKWTLFSMSWQKNNKVLFDKKYKKNGLSFTAKAVLQRAAVVLDPGVVFKGSIKFFKLKYLKASAYAKAELTFKAYLKIKGSYDKSKLKKLFGKHKIYKFMIGPVPVVIKLEGNVFAGCFIRMTASINMVVGYEYRYHLEMGVKYEKGKFRPIWINKKKKKLYKPKTEICLNIYVEGFIRPQLGALLYTTSGPTFELEPYIGFELIGNGLTKGHCTEAGKEKNKKHNRKHGGRVKDSEDSDEDENVADYDEPLTLPQAVDQQLGDQDYFVFNNVDEGEDAPYDPEDWVNDGLEEGDSGEEEDEEEEQEQEYEEDSESEGEEDCDCAHQTTAVRAPLVDGEEAEADVKAVPCPCAKNSPTKPDTTKPQKPKLPTPNKPRKPKLPTPKKLKIPRSPKKKDPTKWMNKPFNLVTPSKIRKVPSYWEIRLGIRARIGLDLKIAGKSLSSWRKTIFDKSIRLAGGCIKMGLRCNAENDTGRVKPSNASRDPKDRKAVDHFLGQLGTLRGKVGKDSMAGKIIGGITKKTKEITKEPKSGNPPAIVQKTMTGKSGVGKLNKQEVSKLKGMKKGLKKAQTASEFVQKAYDDLKRKGAVNSRRRSRVKLNESCTRAKHLSRYATMLERQGLIQKRINRVSGENMIKRARQLRAKARKALRACVPRMRQPKDDHTPLRPGCRRVKRCTCPVAKPMRLMVKRMEKRVLYKPDKKIKALKARAKMLKKVAQKVGNTAADTKEGDTNPTVRKVEREAKRALKYAGKQSRRARYMRVKIKESAHGAMVNTEKATGIRGYVKRGKLPGRRVHCSCRWRTVCRSSCSALCAWRFSRKGRERDEYDILKRRKKACLELWCGVAK